MTEVLKHAFSALTTLHCPDRIVITGTSLDFGHEDAMRSYCRKERIAETGVAAWARPLTTRIAFMAEEMAKETKHGMIDCNVFRDRKDDFVQRLRKQHGKRKFEVLAVFKSMESCRAFYRSQSALKALKGSPFFLRQTKCLHYYVYCELPIIGLACLRIQTYAPFQVQIIINGHDVLQGLLDQDAISYQKRGNAFMSIGDFTAAQELADTITGPMLCIRLQRFINAIIPLSDIMPQGYRLSVRQVEFATDIYLSQTRHSEERYRSLVHQLCLQHPQDFLSYLDVTKRPARNPRCTSHKNHLGTCVKFFNGPTCIKVYHKEPHILRVETVSYNLTKISAVRTIRKRNGTTYVARRPLARALADIQVFWAYARHANQRMIQRLGQLWERCYTSAPLRRIADRACTTQGNYRGINFFEKRDAAVLRCLNNPAHDLTGFKRTDILSAIPDLKPHQATYAIKRMKAHGMIKKEARSHRYFLTNLGRMAATSAQVVNSLVILPILAA